MSKKANPGSRDLATDYVETGRTTQRPVGRCTRGLARARSQPISFQKLALPSSDWLPSELEKGTILTILTIFLFFDKNANKVGDFGL